MMEILYLIIPVSLLLLGLIVWALLWSIQADQYEDLEGPAHRLLMDDDSHIPPDPGKAASSDSHE